MSEACFAQGCPGQFEAERVLRAMRFGDRVIVVDDVPAEVCDLCGLTLFAPDTVDLLDRLVRNPPRAQSTVPLYSYRDAAAMLSEPAVAVAATGGAE